MKYEEKLINYKKSSSHFIKDPNLDNDDRSRLKNEEKVYFSKYGSKNIDNNIENLSDIDGKFKKKSSLPINKSIKKIISINSDYTSNSALNMNQDKKAKSKNSGESVVVPKFYKNIQNSIKLNLDNNHNSSNNSSSITKKNDANSTIRNSLIKTFQDRIFWNQTQIIEVRNKLKEGCQKIIQKKQLDFDEIDGYMQFPNEQSFIDLKEKITDPVFKSFYYKEMRSSELLDKMFKSGFAKLVRELLDSDPDYFVFDYNLIINLFEENLQSTEVDLADIRNQQLQHLLGECIKYQLYPKPTSYLIAYLSSIYKFYDEFKEIISKEPECFEEDYELYNGFTSSEDIFNFSNSRETFNIVVGYCLKNDWEKIAIVLFQTKQEDIDPEIVKISVSSLKLTFLQYLWEFWNKKVAESLKKTIWGIANIANLANIASPSEILDQKLENLNYLNPKIIFTVSDILEEFYRQKVKPAIFNTIISKWGYLQHDRRLLEVLFELKLYEEISTLIQRGLYSYWSFKYSHFEDIIKNQQLNLICFFLEKMQHLCSILNNANIQEIIVLKYMKLGNKIYYGSEMLSCIYKNNWSQDLTKDLCKSILRTIKTKDILNCHSPILTCVSLAEFLSKIGSISVLHESRIEKVVKELLQFCENIQNSTNDESYIKFLMNQRSVYGRTAFQITSENDYYQCLNNPNIGTLVGKMWNGEISQNGLFKASRLHRYLETNKNKQTDPFLEFEPLDANKSYVFQLSVWEDSCSLRYGPESVLTFFLIINYNLYIYFITLDGKYQGSWSDITKHNDKVNFFYFLYLAQAIALNVNIVLQIVWSMLSGRKIKLTYWNLVEFIMLILALSLKIEFHSEQEKLEGINHFQTSSIIETSLLCLNDIIVWIRIAGVLLTFKNFGPIIRMVYLMAILLLKYILIYCLFIVCMSAVFTAIFFGSSDDYKNFSTSLVSLTTPFVNYFRTGSFVKNDLFGAIMVMVYTALSAVLLINLLIAVLSSVYDELSKQVDASHRSILIKYYLKYQWDKKYGYFILLPTALNFVNILVLPFQFIVSKFYKEDQERFNKFICKAFFVVFFFPLIFLAFAVYSLVLIPFCYLKCVISAIKLQFNFRGSQKLKIYVLGKVLFLGLPNLFWFYVQDLYYITKYQFNEPVVQQSNIDRIKNFINKDDILIFLEFIHGRSSKKDENTLNAIFIDYLSYEQMKKIESDFKIKAKADYLDKLRKQAQKSTNASTMMFNPTMHPKKKRKLANGDEVEEDDVTKSFIKKNLIIIEILENFLIETDNEDFNVDIEKLKLLLPKGLEINDDYIQRLIHTDISSINRAVNKLKTSKNVLLQYQLINKIMNNAIKIDKDIDYEVQRNLLIKRTELRENHMLDYTVGFQKMISIMKNISEFSKIKMEKREKKLLREKKLKESDVTTKFGNNDNRTQVSEVSKQVFKRKQTLAKNFGVTLMSK